ncbi:MAG TPA: FAD:protein FMN transferase, partial [Acholeplasma sp.]|nr:FAD:protein FMN transferase [Acholeplasma sp.]
MKKILLVTVMIFGLLLLVGCKTKKPADPLTRSMSEYMYTSISVTLFEGTEADLDEIEKIYQEYTIITNNFNFKDDDSDGVNDYESNPFFGLVSLYDVNENAYNAPVVVSRKLFDVLLDAKKLYEDTDGYFNAGIGNAVDIIKKRITAHMFGSIDDAEFDLMLGELSAIKNTVNYEDVV